MIVRVFVYSRMWVCGKCWYRATEKPNRQPKFGVKNRSKPTGNAKSRTVTTLITNVVNNYNIQTKPVFQTEPNQTPCVPNPNFFQIKLFRTCLQLTMC